jgi:hypothetical protein
MGEDTRWQRIALTLQRYGESWLKPWRKLITASLDKSDLAAYHPIM